MTNVLHLIMTTNGSIPDFQWDFVVHVVLEVNIMVFNATFNNMSVKSWWSGLLVEEAGVPGENHVSAACHWETILHNIASSTPWQSGIQNSQVQYMYIYDNFF